MTRNRLRAAALGLLACAALAAPATAEPGASNAHAGHATADHRGTPGAPVSPVREVYSDTPADYPGMPGAPGSAVREVYSDTPADYPGMPGAPAGREVTSPASPVGRGADGFDWPSAAIGAAAAGLVIVLALAGASVLSRRRLRVAR